jgi:hypothetical protein
MVLIVEGILGMVTATLSVIQQGVTEHKVIIGTMNGIHSVTLIPGQPDKYTTVRPLHTWMLLIPVRHLSAEFRPSGTIKKKNVMKIFNILIFTTLSLTACANSNDSKLRFYGKTIEVAYPQRIDTLKGYTVNLDGVYTGPMFAYDGMLVFVSFRHPDKFMHLFDVETGKHINAIGVRGQGPDDFLSLGFFGHFERDSSGINMWVTNVPKSDVRLINTRGEILKRIDGSNFKTPNQFGLATCFVLNDSLLIAYVQPEEIFENNVSATNYHIYNYKTGQTIKIHEIYSGFRVSEKIAQEIEEMIAPPSYLNSAGGVKSDRSKEATVMIHLKRINILDLKSGELVSIAPTGAPEIDLISTGRGSVKRYYRGFAFDDDYIFVTEGDFERCTGNIHVFDWDGNFVRILRVNDDADVIAFDPIRRILYTKTDCEQVTAYDLNFLYK